MGRALDSGRFENAAIWTGRHRAGGCSDRSVPGAQPCDRLLSGAFRRRTATGPSSSASAWDGCSRGRAPSAGRRPTGMVDLGRPSARRPSRADRVCPADGRRGRGLRRGLATASARAPKWVDGKEDRSAGASGRSWAEALRRQPRRLPDRGHELRPPGFTGHRPPAWTLDGERGRHSASTIVPAALGRRRSRTRFSCSAPATTDASSAARMSFGLDAGVGGLVRRQSPSPCATHLRGHGVARRVRRGLVQHGVRQRRVRRRAHPRRLRGRPPRTFQGYMVVLPPMDAK